MVYLMMKQPSKLFTVPPYLTQIWSSLSIKLLIYSQYRMQRNMLENFKKTYLAKPKYGKTTLFLQ